MQHADVVIVGGGLVGLSLAVALADHPIKLCLIEAALPPASPPVWDERCIALNDGSRHIFTGMKLWPALQPQAAPITHTHISERGRFGMVRFSATEAGLDALGHNTPLRAIGEALLARVRTQANCTLLVPAKVTGLVTDDDAMQLQVSDASTGEQQALTAGLLLAADGAQSTIRQLLGGSAEVRDYQQSALVTAVRVQRDLQGTAYERFTPDGPFALLPKPRLAGDAEAGHPCSLIWTLPSAEAEAKVGMSDAAFLLAAESCFGERAGRFLSVGKRIRYPLSRSLHQHQPIARTLFCGNAAQSLHPVAAQGFNLALRDVAALAEWLHDCRQRGLDAGSAAALADYAAARAGDRQRTADFTDQLVRVFSNRIPVFHRLRHLGLMALELAAPAKQAVLRQNLGHRGLAA